MRDGRYVQKPLVGVSNEVFGTVDQLNRAVFGYGAYDSMKRLRTMLIGGEGDHFDRLGRLATKCGVCYEGDVVIIFGHREGRASGSLIVEGASETDEITFRDSVVFVPAGETRVVRGSIEDTVDPRITRSDLEGIIKKGGSRWPNAQKERVINKFFPTEKVTVFADILIKRYLDQLDEQHNKELDILSQVFRVEGSLVYEVDFRPEGKKGELVPYLKVERGTKKGSAKDYRSRADDVFVEATSHKSATISPSPQTIFVDPVDPTKGPNFEEKHYIAIPDKANNEIILLVGEFNESQTSLKKDKAFSYKLESLIKFAGDEGLKITDDLKKQIREIFYGIKWSDFFELPIGEIYRRFVKPVINPEPSSEIDES
jgi:hypothetical protein